MTNIIDLIAAFNFAIVFFVLKYVMIPLGAIMLLSAPLMPLFAWIDYKNDPRVKK